MHTKSGHNEFCVCRVQYELWDSDDVPVPRKELLQKVKGVDALLCVLTEKIDAELLDAAGQPWQPMAAASSLSECKEQPPKCIVF